MKCDELKPFRALDIGNDIYEENTGYAYPKELVDEAIAELKAKVNENNNRANLWLYNAQNEHNAFVTARMGNMKLKAELAKKKEEIAKKGAIIRALERDKCDLWRRFVQLRKALCRLRIGFALRFGKANSGEKIVSYWKHRYKTAPYWDSKTYKDIPQTKE